MHREDNDPRRRSEFRQSGGRLQAVESLHGDIHDHDIRLVLLGELEGLVTVSCFCDDLDPLEALQEGTKAGPHKSMVIRQQNANGAHN